MQERALDEVLTGPVVRPARQRPRRLGDIVFGVVPLAQGEQLHDLPGKVLVRVLTPALRLVQPDQHRRVLAHRNEQPQPVARPLAPKQVVLSPHQVGVPDFLGTGGKVAVPEERHLFLEWPRAVRHPLQPPAAQLEDALALIHLLLPLQLAPLLRAGLAGGSVTFRPGRIGLGPLRIGSGIRNTFVINKIRHRPRMAEGDQPVDFRRGPAETRPVQQVRRRRKVPPLARKRLKHT